MKESKIRTLNGFVNINLTKAQNEELKKIKESGTKVTRQMLETKFPLNSREGKIEIKGNEIPTISVNIRYKDNDSKETVYSDSIFVKGRKNIEFLKLYEQKNYPVKLIYQENIDKENDKLYRNFLSVMDNRKIEDVFSTYSEGAYEEPKWDIAEDKEEFQEEYSIDLDEEIKNFGKEIY